MLNLVAGRQDGLGAHGANSLHGRAEKNKEVCPCLVVVAVPVSHLEMGRRRERQ